MVVDFHHRGSGDFWNWYVIIIYFPIPSSNV